MRRFRSWPRLALVLALAVMNGGCILIPEIKEKTVELAVSGSTTATFSVVTNDATLNLDEPVTLNSEFDLATVLKDAGIDPSQVTGVAVSGVSYSITSKDPEPSRAITNGTITIRRDAGPNEILVTAFSAAPGARSGYVSIPLGTQGVGVLNLALDDVRKGLQNPPPAPSVNLTFHLAGNNGSVNGSANTNFVFSLKLAVSIKGKIQVSVPT